MIRKSGFLNIEDVGGTRSIERPVGNPTFCTRLRQTEYGGSNATMVSSKNFSWNHHFVRLRCGSHPLIILLECPLYAAFIFSPRIKFV